MDFPVELLKTFLAIIDTGGFTNAGQAVHRTQSAISMQMKRLEASVGRPLFERRGRGYGLTADGERLVPYARRMLKLHDETIAAMVQPEMAGAVCIGTPDDYAFALLPQILARFASRYPQVQVTVICEPSSRLAIAQRRGDTDLTLLTGEQYMDYGEVVRHEQLVWVAPRHQLLHEETPLPLAMFQADCIFRRHAFQSLAAQGRDYRVAYQSASTAGILAAVSAGLAMTVLAESVVPDGFRIAGAEEGLPALPMAPVVLATRPAGGTAVVATLAGFIREAMQATRGRSGVNPAVS